MGSRRKGSSKWCRTAPAPSTCPRDPPCTEVRRDLGILGATLPYTPLGAQRTATGEVWVAYLDRPVLTRHRREGGPGSRWMSGGLSRTRCSSWSSPWRPRPRDSSGWAPARGWVAWIQAPAGWTPGSPQARASRARTPPPRDSSWSRTGTSGSAPPRGWGGTAPPRRRRRLPCRSRSCSAGASTASRSGSVIQNPASDPGPIWRRGSPSRPRFRPAHWISKCACPAWTGAGCGSTATT